MKSAIEILYNESIRENGFDTHAQNAAYAGLHTIKKENIRLLNDSMTKEQRDWLDAYATANEKTEEIIRLENFRYAFYLGVRFMADLSEARGFSEMKSICKQVCYSKAENME